VNSRAICSLAALLAILLVLPAFANSYVLSRATLVLLLASTGQAWNILMGFAGQLSLGHALYLGLGGYAAAGLYYHFGIGPWLGVWLALLVCAAAGAFIGILAFRYRVSGVYFALLTIAFAEFTRIGFDHMSWFGGSGGLFLKVTQRDRIDLLNLRGPPVLFYYTALALASGTLALSAWALRRRAGFYWLAIRENEDAARALGIDALKWKMLAMVLSAAMTGLAGVFMAFYYNNLFPEHVFHIGRSIEIILGPIIGGIGTLFGPLVGAALLSLIAESATELLGTFGWQFAGMKQLLYGVILFAAIWLLPNGVWAPLAKKLGLTR
jgi:branched-chain amino acid transport system permease protein